MRSASWPSAFAATPTSPDGMTGWQKIETGIDAHLIAAVPASKDRLLLVSQAGHVLTVRATGAVTMMKAPNGAEVLGAALAGSRRLALARTTASWALTFPTLRLERTRRHDGDSMRHHTASGNRKCPSYATRATSTFNRAMSASASSSTTASLVLPVCLLATLVLGFFAAEAAGQCQLRADDPALEPVHQELHRNTGQGCPAWATPSASSSRTRPAISSTRSISRRCARSTTRST